MPLSRNILSKKARAIAIDLGFDSFKGSKGYIDKFVKRNDIVPVQLQAVANWSLTMRMHYVWVLSLKLGQPCVTLALNLGKEGVA